MKDKGRSCELVKAWVVRRDRGGDIFTDLFEEKDEAVKFAWEIDVINGWDFYGIYETIAVKLDGELLSVYRSDDIDRIYGGALPDTLDGVKNGESLLNEELEKIIKG